MGGLVLHARNMYLSLSHSLAHTEGSKSNIPCCAAGARNVCRRRSQTYLGYCVTPSNYGLLPQDTSLRERVEKSCWTSLAYNDVA
jgi:hypothetical protein